VSNAPGHFSPFYHFIGPAGPFWAADAIKWGTSDRAISPFNRGEFLNEIRSLLIKWLNGYSGGLLKSKSKGGLYAMPLSGGAA